MFDKFATLVVQLLDKHLAVATIMIGVLSLYLLGFTADKLVAVPYAVIALVFMDIFVRVATYVHILYKIGGNNLKKEIAIVIDKIDILLDINESLSNLHDSIIDNINSLNHSVFKICGTMRGIPNKAQLRLFISMRTKLYVMEVIEQSISYIYTYALKEKESTLTTMNRKKIALDLHKKQDLYYKEIAVYLSAVLLSNAEKEVSVIIDLYVEEIIDMLDSNIMHVEKIYNMMIINTTTEEKLMKVWYHYIANLPDGHNLLDDEEDDV